MNDMIKTLFKAFEVRWKSYRHRFVPWIALNLQKNQRYRLTCVSHTLNMVMYTKWIGKVLVLQNSSSGERSLTRQVNPGRWGVCIPCVFIHWTLQKWPAKSRWGATAASCALTGLQQRWARAVSWLSCSNDEDFRLQCREKAQFTAGRGHRCVCDRRTRAEGKHCRNVSR